MRGLLDNRDELVVLFDELAAELTTLGRHAEVVMVGGSWMLWHSLRTSTRDVDSARRFEADLTSAIQLVGRRHELQPDWLNDAASPFWPAEARYADCKIVFEHESLVVRTPRPEVIFTMKLYRADPQDREDLINLWPLCRFVRSEEAVDAFWRAYPHAPDDEYLVSYIDDVARDAAQ